MPWESPRSLNPWTAIRRERFDVFLTDCNIPGVDALRTSDEVRRINPDMAVIIMTSFGTIETAVKAIKAGAYDYLPKPIDLEQLAVLIERISERQNLIRENHGAEGTAHRAVHLRRRS